MQVQCFTTVVQRHGHGILARPSAARDDVCLHSCSCRSGPLVAQPAAQTPPSELVCAGVSSFAFMGTNAHVVIAHRTAASALSAPPSTTTQLQMRHRSHWCAAQPHLLALRASFSPSSSVVSFQADLSHPLLAHLWEHVVGGQHIFPGAGYMEMAAAAARLVLLPHLDADSDTSEAGGMDLALTDASIPSPLVLPSLGEGAKAVALPVLLCTVDVATGRVVVSSTTAGDSPSSTASSDRAQRRQRRQSKPRPPATSIHLTATASLTPAFSSTATVACVPAPDSGLARLHALLTSFTRSSAHTAPASSKTCATACLLQPHLPDDAAAAAAFASQSDGLLLGVGLVDSFLQLGQLLIPSPPDGQHIFVPSGWGALLVGSKRSAVAASALQQRLGSSVAVVPQESSSASGAGSQDGSTAQISSDYRLCASSGTVLCAVGGMAARPLVGAGQRTGGKSSAALPPKTQQQEQEPDLLYSVEWQAAEPEQEGASYQVSSLDLLSLSPDGAAPSSLALGVLQQLTGARLPALRIVAQGANTEATVLDSEGPVALGAARTAALEAYTSSFTAAQLDTSGATGYNTQATTISIPAEPAPAGSSSSSSSTPVDVYGASHLGRTVRVPRLQRAPQQAPPAAYQLVPKPRGALDSLVPVPLDPAALQPLSYNLPTSDGSLPAGRCAVRVAAVGLNFRDVLNVLGMYPGDPGAPGGDCSGVVVGGGSPALPAGTAVFGLAAGSLGTLVHCRPATLAAMPGCLTFEEAATMPTVFITAHQVFGAAAALRPGERVLLHGAAGGVGLASLQVVSALGGQVVATAGSPAKRALLRGLGVRHVANSRDLSFVEEVAVATGGRGVSVVLNSLTSPGMVAASLAGLSRGGRWVEIGKRDVWSAARVQSERPDVRYGLLAVDFLPPQVRSLVL